MSNTLEGLKSRKLAFARDKATEAQHELHETVAILQQAEREAETMFPWTWETIQPQLLTDAQVQSVDYLGALQVTGTAVKTNWELLGKAIESTKTWLKSQRDLVVKGRQLIEDETKNRDSIVRHANEGLRQKEDRAQNIEKYVRLPENEIIGGCGGCALAAVGGFIGLVIGGQLFGTDWLVGFSREIRIAMGIAMSIIGAIAPSTWGPYLIRRKRCKEIISNAKQEAEAQLSEARHSCPTIVSTAEQEFQKQMAQLQAALESVEAMEEGAHEAHRLVEARYQATEEFLARKVQGQVTWQHQALLRILRFRTRS